MVGLYLGGDKRFYRNLLGRVCPLHRYHYFRCDLKKVFPALASFLIALPTALLDPASPPDKTVRDRCSILVVKTTRNMHTALFSK